MVYELYKLDDSWAQGAEEEEEISSQNKSSLCWSGTHTGFNPLHVAASQGYGSLVIVLLALGIDVMEKTAENTIYRLFTPLHLAAQNGHRHIFEAILYFTKNAAQVKKYVKERLKESDKSGILFSTPVDSAATTFFPRIPSHLLRDVNLYDVDDYGMVEENQVAKSQMNVEAPPEGFIAPLSPNESSEWFNQLLNKKNGDGETALHVATGRGRTEIVQFVFDLALSTHILYLQKEIESINNDDKHGDENLDAQEDGEEEEKDDDKSTDEEDALSDEEAEEEDSNNVHSNPLVSALSKRVRRMRKADQRGRTIGIDEESSRLAGAVLLAAEKSDEHLIAPFAHYTSLLSASVQRILEGAAQNKIHADSAHPSHSSHSNGKSSESNQEKSITDTFNGEGGDFGSNAWNWTSRHSDAASKVLPSWSVIDWHRKEIAHGDLVMHGVVQAGLQRVFNYNYPLPPTSLSALYLLISHSPSHILHCPSYGINRSLWSNSEAESKKSSPSSLFPYISSISLDLNNDGDHPFDYLLEAQADWFEAVHAIAFWHSFVASHFAHHPQYRASPSFHQSYPVVWQLLDACESQASTLDSSSPSSPLFAGIAILLAHIRRYLRFDTDTSATGEGQEGVDFIRVPSPFSLPSDAMLAKLGHKIGDEEKRKQKRREEEDEAGAAPCKLIDTSTIPFTRKFAHLNRENPIQYLLDGSMPPPPSGHPDIGKMEEGASCPLGFKKKTTAPTDAPPSGHPDIGKMAEGATCPLGFKKKTVAPAAPSEEAPPSGHPDISKYPPGAVCPMGFGKKKPVEAASETVNSSSSSNPSTEPPPPAGHPDISKYPPGAVCPMGFGKKKPLEAVSENLNSSASSSSSPSTEPPPPAGHPDISKYPPGAVCPMGFGKKKVTEGTEETSSNSSQTGPSATPSPTPFLFEKIVLLGALGALASLAVYRFFNPS